MAIIGLLLSVLTLLFIFIQDLQYRAVSWILFPMAVLAVNVAAFANGLDWVSWWVSVLPNLLFLFLNLLLILIWFSVKKVKPDSILKQYLGIGDILFFLVMALGLPFPVFPVVFVASLILSLMAGLIIYRNSTVPLAGIQALILMLWITLDYFQVVTLNQFIFSRI